MGRAWPGGAPATAGCSRQCSASRGGECQIRACGQAKRAAKFLPRQGVARERRRAPLLVSRASNASLSTPEAHGGGVDGVAGWRQNWNAAARDGKANGAGGFARRREQGEGVSRSRTRRGASEARWGRGGLRAERHTRERRERKHAPLAERACGGMAVRNARAGPKGSHALRARGSCPAAVRGQRAGRRGAGACLSAAKGAERCNPTAARSHIARRRARLDWRRGQPRASEG